MITLEVTILKSWKERTIGLLGETKARPVLLKTRFGIHTFGMKFSIDVLVLDQHNTVVTLVENLQQNLIFVWSPRFDTIIELPAGAIKKYTITVGEKLQLTPLT